MSSQKAGREVKKMEFEMELMKVYEKHSTLLTGEELNEVVNRFARKILPSGRG